MLTLSVQAGGKSSRMGKDKALLDFGGQTLIEHLLARLDSLAQETIITTNNPERYRFLGLPLFPDLIPGRGALGGLLTALEFASHSFVAVVACDMPFANVDILRTCRDVLARNTYLDAVIPSTTRGLEPLHAVYRRDTCLLAVKSAIEAGFWKVISWHGDVNVKILPPEEVARLDPDGNAFENVNTPEEFKLAIQYFNQNTG